MGEYLSPGVFIEEIPARLKAIEGVSTSTAGFVGGADRGPMAGFVPFQPVGTATIPAHFKFAPDPTPVLVTSFADYQRVFGAPPADPKRDGYLGRAVQAFVNNGGRRRFVARAVAAAAKPAKVRVNRGVVLRLARAGRVGDPTVFLTSLRGLNLGAGNDLSFKRISDDTTVADLDLNAASGTATSATLAAAAGLTVALDPDQVYAVPAAATAVVADEGPQFIARGPGTWGNNLRVLISNSDRPPVKLAGPV